MYWALVLLGTLICSLNCYRTKEFNAEEFMASLRSAKYETSDRLDVPEDAFLNIVSCSLHFKVHLFIKLVAVAIFGKTWLSI